MFSYAMNRHGNVFSVSSSSTYHCMVFSWTGSFLHFNSIQMIFFWILSSFINVAIRISGTPIFVRGTMLLFLVSWSILIYFLRSCCMAAIHGCTHHNHLDFLVVIYVNVIFILLSTQNPTDFILHLAIFSCNTKRGSSVVMGLPLLGACFLFQHKLRLLVINLLSSDCSTRWAFLRSCFYVDSFWVFQFHMMTFMIITGIQTSSWLLVSRYGTSGRACASEMHQLALPGWLRKEGRLSSKLGVVFTSLILINTTMIYCA